VDISKVKIFDDWLDDIFIHEIDHFTDDNIKWSLSNIANNYSFPYGYKGSHKFWGSLLYQNIKDNPSLSLNKCPSLIWNLYNFINNKFLKNHYKLVLTTLNGQGMGQDGSSHVDFNKSEPTQNPYTFMVFINKSWKLKWGGDFQFLDSLDNTNCKVLKTISYKPGRMVFFKGDIPHRALSPTVPYIIRKSLVFKLEKIN